MKIEDYFKIPIIVLLITASFAINSPAYSAEQSIDMPAETLRDKIRGGLLGQLLGNLNGLKHEMKYINAPGNVQQYTPALPEGARTDDDTDLEWVYIVAMQKNNTTMLSLGQITQLWLERINNRIDNDFGFDKHFIRGKAKMQTRAGLSIAIMMTMALDHVGASRIEQMRSLVRPISAAK